MSRRPALPSAIEAILIDYFQLRGCTIERRDRKVYVSLPDGTREAIGHGLLTALGLRFRSHRFAADWLSETDLNALHRALSRDESQVPNGVRS
jgi:hypothetical protein